jgi:dihydrofolate reductase
VPSLIGLIVAIAKNRIIGIDGKIPWHHPADLKRFKAVTTGHTVIMGRNTYASIGRPLPNRRNIVVTRTDIPGVECVRSLDQAFQAVEGEAWIIGGAKMYEEALAKAHVIDVTFVPDDIAPVPQAVYFPEIPSPFQGEPEIQMEEGLVRRRFHRKVATQS